MQGHSLQFIPMNRGRPLEYDFFLFGQKDKKDPLNDRFEIHCSVSRSSRFCLASLPGYIRYLLKNPISICRKRVGFKAGGLETLHIEKRESSIAPYYGCSLSLGKHPESSVRCIGITQLSKLIHRKYIYIYSLVCCFFF